MPQRVIRRGTLAIAAALGLLAILSANAYAEKPPTVALGAASNIRLNTATFSGTVNGNGASNTTYKFEYGKTKSYGQSTPALKLTGTGAVPVNLTAVGMEPLSTYHYRLSATNIQGTTYSEDGVVELLTSWRVGGQPVSELASPATFQTEARWLEEGGVLEVFGTSGPYTVDIQCFKSTPWSGALGVEFNGLKFRSCRTLLNGKVEESCKPIGEVDVHVNGKLAQTSPIVVETNELCPPGSEFKFENGGVGAKAKVGEAKTFGWGMEGPTYRNQAGFPREWKLWLSSPALELNGEYAGQVWGLS
jgi:hypothetical protein